MMISSFRFSRRNFRIIRIDDRILCFVILIITNITQHHNYHCFLVRKNLTFDDLHRIFRFTALQSHATSFVNIFYPLDEKVQKKNSRPPIHIFSHFLNPQCLHNDMTEVIVVCCVSMNWRQMCGLCGDLNLWEPTATVHELSQSKVCRNMKNLMFKSEELNGQTNTQMFHKLLTLESCILASQFTVHGWKMFHISGIWKNNEKNSRLCLSNSFNPFSFTHELFASHKSRLFAFF